MTVRETSKRTAVVPESFFNALGARLSKDLGSHAAQNVLYELGRDAGHSFIAVAEDRLGRRIKTEADYRDLLRLFAEEFGWAHMSLKSIDLPGKHVVVEWWNGVGVPTRGSPEPVCHLGRGLLSGATEVVFGGSCDAIETQCQAMGAKRCEIVVGVPNQIAYLSEEREPGPRRKASR